MVSSQKRIALLKNPNQFELIELIKRFSTSATTEHLQLNTVTAFVLSIVIKKLLPSKATAAIKGVVHTEYVNTIIKNPNTIVFHILNFVNPFRKNSTNYIKGELFYHEIYSKILSRENKGRKEKHYYYYGQHTNSP